MSESEAVETVETTDVETDVDTAPETEENHDTFPRQVVEDLRRESAGYRERAKTAEARVTELAQQRHESLVRLDGRLQDFTDLPFTADAVLDAEAITEAITELIAAKPHLKSRKPTGDIGQGMRGAADEPFSLIGAIKNL
jgi:hypothetical protein